eukprot:scaffold29929_cov19-Tisochrysis_lutea.AAC.1
MGTARVSSSGCRAHNGHELNMVPLLCLQVQVGAEPGVEYDADSENELIGPQGLAKRAAGSGKQVRFEMLHNLWASKRALPKA